MGCGSGGGAPTLGEFSALAVDTLESSGELSWNGSSQALHMPPLDKLNQNFWRYCPGTGISEKLSR